MNKERTKESQSVSAKEVQGYYDTVYFAEGRPYARAPRGYRQILSKVEPRAGEVLLDISCGAGSLLLAARQHGLTAFGIDISKRALDRAVESGVQRLVRGQAETLPVADRSMDIVTCLGSLEHYLDPEAAVSEMIRVLKPGGRTLITVPNYYYWLNVLHAALHGDHKTGHRQVVERVDTYVGWTLFFENNGLRVRRVFKDRGPLPPLRGNPWTILKRLVRWSLAYTVPRNLTYQFGFICSVD